MKPESRYAARIKELAAEGYAPIQVSDVLGCSRSFASMVMRGKRCTGERRLTERRERARLVKEAAARQSVSKATVYRRIADWGEHEAFYGEW